MTDAHCHVSCGDSAVREFLIGRDFIGVHPWEAAKGVDLGAMREELAARPELGVGEIGLDRLHDRIIPSEMCAAFESQMKLAAEFHRPVVLHGAKCWGQVVTACRAYAHDIPTFLFHGFSRSDGLIPDIVALNGFISVGPAVLNDHAVNYRALVKKIPADRLLVETDRTTENAAECPGVAAVAAKLAELRGVSADELLSQLERNADAFRGGCAFNHTGTTDVLVR